MNVSLAARGLVERLTRTWVYRRSLPHDFGRTRIFVTPAGGLKYLFKPMSRVDEHLLRNAMELVRPGDVVWDVGANIGLFAFAAAVRSGEKGKVIAFEPDAWLVQLLRRSAAIQPSTSAPVSVVPAAVASTISLRSFAIASRARAANALVGYGRPQMGNVHETQTIVALNLDWLLENLPAPNVIKCDVEGAEVEVFSGQIKIMRKVRPAIICEVGEDSVEPMTALLAREKYRLFDGDRPLSRNTEILRASWNTLAIPDERLSEYLPAAC